MENKWSLRCCVPHVSQEAVGVGHSAPLSQLLIDIMLQLPAEVVQLKVFLFQIPGEATLQLLQPAVKILVCVTAATTERVVLV